MIRPALNEALDVYIDAVGEGSLLIEDGSINGVAVCVQGTGTSAAATAASAPTTNGVTSSTVATSAYAAGFQASASDAQVSDLRQRLQVFYAEHNPAKIETLDVFSRFWAGKEAKLNSLLRWGSPGHDHAFPF